MATYKDKSISGDDTFTDPLQIIGSGNFSVSLSGVWDASVTVQRSFDDGATWVDVEVFTANTEKVGFESVSSLFYRIGIKAGGYTSGTLIARIGY